ncbi:MAG: IS200/IS605 family transposase [Candidatus Binatia bacterium]
MPQSLAKILVHVIFSTKNREPMIAADIRTSLHAYITGILQNLRCPSLRTGGTADHVHTLLSMARTRAVAEVVEQVKTGSSKWMKHQGIREFRWQSGYGAFSIGESQVRAVIRYIGNQDAHHRQRDFQSEFRRLLDRYGVAYDERYVWD